MVKDSQSKILFSPLLKKDDGVLRSLLQESGLGEIEVAATIDRFIFELKHATAEVGGEFELAEFGVLRHDEGGKLIFISVEEVIAQREAEAKKAEDAERAERAQAAKMEQVSQDAERSEDMKEAKEVEAADVVAAPPAAIVAPEVVGVVGAEPQKRTAPTQESTPESQQHGSTDSHTSRYSADKIKELYSRPQSFREKDPEIEDLTYSKRQKPLAGYTFAQRGPRKKKMDKVLLFGIIAAVIAVVAIAYGYYVSHLDEIYGLMIDWGLMSVDGADQIIEAGEVLDATEVVE